MTEFLFIVLILTVLFGISYGLVLLFTESISKINLILSTFLLGIIILSWFFFFFGSLLDSHDYFIPIDSIESMYTPISYSHAFSFWVFYYLSLLGTYKIWKYGKKQAPLLLVVYIVFLIIGIVLNSLLLIQLSSHKVDEYTFQDMNLYMMLAPSVHLLISILLLIKLVRTESTFALERTFKNKFLNHLNQKIANSNRFSLWVIFAFLPIYCIITLVLILFGQDYDSLSKVFTETTTWHFSQKTHPPFLEHEGHYLCTVAACGSPNIVKPIRLGTRHGNEIIVNRQLLISNAFEEVIKINFPKFHTWIRRNYDKYGYPLSKDINTKFKSNVTYILMKPLEWIFLIVVYLSVEKPEKLINEQYKWHKSE